MNILDKGMMINYKNGNCLLFDICENLGVCVTQNSFLKFLY